MDKHYTDIDKEYFHRRVFTGIVSCSLLCLIIVLTDWVYFKGSLPEYVNFVLIALCLLGYISSFVYAFYVLHSRVKTKRQKRIYQTFLGNKWTYGLSWMALGLQSYFVGVVLIYWFYSGGR